MAGTACAVNSCTVVAFGYQVAPRASRPKFGNLVLSIRPLGSSSDVTGNSSSTTRTPGTREVTTNGAASASSTVVGSPCTNQATAATGRSTDTVRNSLSARTRTYPATPSAQSATTSTSVSARLGSSSFRPRKATGKRKPASAARNIAAPTQRDTRPARAAYATAASGGPKAT